MRIEVVVPDLGEGVTDAFIVAWHKQVGDTVLRDDILAEVMTDKTNVDVSAPASGTVEAVLVEADERVKVGEVIAVLEAG